MILQQLYRDADDILRQTGQGELPPAMFGLKRVRWEIRLDSEGPAGAARFVPLVAEGKAGARGYERLVPDAKRTVGIRPLLLADKTSYTLGLHIADAKRDANRDAGRDRERATSVHSAFKDLVRDCAAQTGDPLVARVSVFLDAWDSSNLPADFPSDVGKDDVFVFMVDGGSPLDSPAVRTFWAARCRSAEPSSDGDPAEGASEAPQRILQCLVSGLPGPVEKMMPVSVKGIPGGQSSGMQIVSANANAFESYGLERAQTSPISLDAGLRFGRALNALIASDRHHRNASAVTYVFWSRAGLVRLLPFEPEFAETATVRDLVDAIRRGEHWREESIADDDLFHIFGLSPNAARVVIRSALDMTIGELAERQATWFTKLDIVAPDGDPGPPLPLWRLAGAPYRDRKDIAPGVEDALVSAAFGETPLPESLLRSIVMRCRLDTKQRVTYERAALLKYILTQPPTWSPEETQKMSDEITTSDAAPAPLDKREMVAYHLGRLFAELESIQRAAIPGINASISDRFFGSASSAPASVFGQLLSGAQNHLSKLIKGDEREQRIAVASRRRMEDILWEIQVADGAFPHTLPLRYQALFALGYYHHRAAARRNRPAATIAAAAANSSPSESTDRSVAVADPA
jgi:CRISPR-associated protein Csd1